MRRTKAGRWERMANNAVGFEGVDSEEGAWILKSDVVKLLRREHRAVLRLARQVYNWQAEQLADDEDAMATFIEHLKKRAR